MSLVSLVDCIRTGVTEHPSSAPPSITLPAPGDDCRVGFDVSPLAVASLGVQPPVSTDRSERVVRGDGYICEWLDAQDEWLLQVQGGEELGAVRCRGSRDFDVELRAGDSLPDGVGAFHFLTGASATTTS